MAYARTGNPGVFSGFATEILITAPVVGSAPGMGIS